VKSPQEFDVSRVVRLRRQVARARPALMVIALCTSFFGLVLIHVTAGLMLVVGVVVTVWFAFRIAKGMRSGRRWAAVIAAVWWFGWLAFVLLQVPKVMETEINRNSVLGGIGFLASLYFLARGLLAFRSLQRTRDDPAGPLAHHPWEEGLPSLQRRPRFLNKTSLWAYVFLIISPLPWLGLRALSIRRSELPDDRWAEAAGEQMVYVGIGLAVWAWVACIYRRARRYAMLPGSELVKWDKRAIVLYLRSFQDDSRIRLRARNTNGRILPERLLRVSYEEVITDHLWRYGPVLAIGSPGTKDPLAPLGAARDYASDVTWREKATELMAKASMIVGIAGRTEGFGWELDAIVRLGFRSKLVLLLPPVSKPELEARWQFLTSRVPDAGLPSSIDLGRTRALVFPGEDYVQITSEQRNDWSYEAVLDQAAFMVAG
jgi:hypothetical protein